MSTTSKVFAGLCLATLLAAVYLTLGLLNTYKVYGEAVASIQKQIVGLEQEIQRVKVQGDEANPSISTIAIHLRRLQQTKGGGIWFGVGKLQGPNDAGEIQLGLSPLVRPPAEGLVFNPFMVGAGGAGDAAAPPPEAPAPEAPAEGEAPAGDAPAGDAAAPPPSNVPGFVKGVPFPQEVRQASVLHVFRDITKDGKLSGYRYLGAFRVKQVEGEPAATVTVTPEEGFGPNAAVTDAQGNLVNEVQFASQEVQALMACDPNKTVLTVMSALPADDREVFANATVESLKMMDVPEAIAQELVADGKPAPADAPEDRVAKKWVVSKEFKRPNAGPDEPPIAEGAELLLTEPEAKRVFGATPKEYANVLPDGVYRRPLFDFGYTLRELRRIRTNDVIVLEQVVGFQKLAEQTVTTMNSTLATRQAQKARLDADLKGIQGEIALLQSFVRNKKQTVDQLTKQITALESRTASGGAPAPIDAAPAPALDDDNSAGLTRVVR